MKKSRKVVSTFTLDPKTKKALEDFCEEHRTWNMSVFVDVAIQEKLEREKK